MHVFLSLYSFSIKKKETQYLLEMSVYQKMKHE